MSNLTKTEILAGTRTKKFKEIELADGKVWEAGVRALTQGEMMEIQSEVLGHFKMGADSSRKLAALKAESNGELNEEDVLSTIGDIDLASVMQAMYRADCMAVARALPEDQTWSWDEVDRIPSKDGRHVEVLSGIVYSISGGSPITGITKEASLRAERFREDEGGAGSDAPPSEGSPSDSDTSGSDTAAEPVPAEGS